MQGRVAIQNQQYWKSIGADYIYYDQGPLPGYYETQDDYDLRWPLWYVASKGMWDASLTSEQILKDACRKLYGSAADATWRELTTVLVADDVIPAVRAALRSKFARAKNTAQGRGAIRAQTIVELEKYIDRTYSV